MGGCFSSQSGRKESVNQQRRRLSLSQSEAVVNDNKGDSRGKVQKTTQANILELFPDSGRRLSLSGKPADTSQKGFDNKKTEALGGSKVADFNVGFACKKGLKPESPNQDDFVVLAVDDWGIYGVFDGHGPYGHDISNFCHDTLPGLLVRDGNFYSEPEKAFKTAFKKTHVQCEQAANKGRFDCSLSGTTGTVVMHRDGKLYCAWVGDSRAVMATRKNGKIISEDLSDDHKPEREDEKKRIQASGGQVRKLEGDIPHRVFLKGKLYPGLAMSRSLGDTVGVAAGVSNEPDVKVRTVNKASDRFMMVCSDGVWEFISSQEAVDIVNRFPVGEVQQASEALAQEAWKRWIQEEGNVVDDITVIVVWLGDDGDSPPAEAAPEE